MAKTSRNDPCPCGSGKKYKKCHGGHSTVPQSIEEVLEAMSRESQAIEENGFGKISEGFAELVRDLRSYDRLSCLTAVAALALVAKNRTCIVRLDALQHFVAIHANGKHPVTIGSLDRWLNQLLSHSPLSRREDPAEDVAIGNVMTKSGNFRIFTGDWSNPDYYVQDVLDALEKGPESLALVRAECSSILAISELLASRKDYPRLTGKPESESAAVWLPLSDEALWALSRQVLIDSNDLAILQVTASSIEPFSISFEDFCANAPNATVGSLRRRPFITLGDILIVAHPTAMSMALISHVFSSVRRLNLLGGLENSLGAIQGARTLRESADDIIASDFLTQMLPQEGAPSARYVSQVAFRFDGNKYLHLLFLHDDVHDIERGGPASQWHPPFRDSFSAFIEASSKKFIEEAGCVGGFTLIVMGGVWRGCAMTLPQKLMANCGLQVWSSADIDRLMSNERRWKLLLWKLSMQRRTLEQLGVSLQAHSDANLYSMWTHHDHRLIPRDAGIDSPNHVTYGAEFIFDMRLDNRSGTDDHCIYRPDRGKWERVRKLNSRAHFKEDAARKTYGALHRVTGGILEGAVETVKRGWWIDCSTNISDTSSKYLIYNVWETVVNWIDRIAPTLDELIPELGGENIIFSLDVSEIVNNDDWTVEGMMSIPPATSIPTQRHGRAVSLFFPIAFVAMGYSPNNEAERLLVETLVRATLAMAGIENHQERSGVIHSALALSDDHRFMHLFSARDSRDYLQDFDHKEPELLHDEELAFGALQIAQEAKLKAPSKIDTVESSNQALHQIVDAFWIRIETRLREIDRADLVTICITNHERLLRDLDRWQRTSRAVLSLHEDRSDVLKATQALKEKRDRTQITSRILIEMAVCTCPLDSGRPVTQADIDYLESQVLLLIATAAHSDAVRTNCANPSMQISRLGDFTFGDNFMDVMHPYMTSHFEKSHMADVQRYGEFFSPPPETQTPEREVFGDEFVECFRDEFGISPGRLAEAGVLLAEDAIRESAFIVIQEAAAITQVLLAGGLSQAEVDGVWRSFALRPRDQWNAVEKPFRDKDWVPWRYRRRLSLMARPFVVLGDGRIVYAPGFCEDSFRHSVMECFQGAFETGYFDSKRMRKYVGAVNGRRGLEFNKAVGALFEAEGWKVRLEVQMTELKAPAQDASGDVDVLAWKGDVVCVCECKELLFARTITEVADQLVRFRGLAGDDLHKHLRRAEFIQSHDGGLARITSVANPRIVPLLITSKIVPMQFTKVIATEVVSADQVTPDFLAKLLG